MAIIIIETLFLRPHPNKQLENEQRTSPLGAGRIREVDYVP